MKCGRAPLNLNPTWLKARRSASWFSAPLKREGNLGAKSDCKTAALAGGPGYNRRMIRLRSPSGATERGSDRNRSKGFRHRPETQASRRNSKTTRRRTRVACEYGTAAAHLALAGRRRVPETRYWFRRSHSSLHFRPFGDGATPIACDVMSHGLLDLADAGRRVTPGRRPARRPLRARGDIDKTAGLPTSCGRP